MNLLSTSSCFNICWRVSFIVRNKFGAIGEGLESKLAITIIFLELMNSDITTEVTCDHMKSNFKNFKDKLEKFGEKYK